jgi:hypothetical protein
MGCAHRLGSLGGLRAAAAPMTRRVPAAALGLVGVLGAGPVFGGEPLPPPDPIRLEYTSAPGCADAAAFRNEIASRFNGRDPFTDDAPERVVIVLHRRGPALFTAEISHYDAASKLTGQDTPKAQNCTELFDTIVTMVTVDLLPIVGPPKPKPPAPPPPPPEEKPAPAPPPPACPPAPPAPDDALWPLPPPLEVSKPTKPPPEKAPLSFRVGSGVWVDWISSDRGSLGLTLDASLRYLWGSVAVELRGDPAIGTTKVPGYGTVSFARVTGALLACGHLDPLVACLEAQVGGVLFPGTVPPHPAELYAAAGVRLGLEFPIAPSRFILRVDGELLPTIDPESIGMGKVTAFQVAGWNGGIGLGAMFALGKR